MPTAQSLRAAASASLAGRGVQDDALAGDEDEAGARAERRRRLGHVDRAREVAGGVVAGTGGRRARWRRPASSSSAGSSGCATHGPRFSATTRSVVGGLGVETDAETSTNSCTSRNWSAGFVVALASDRRRALGAHVAAAQRAGDVPREDLDRVAELGQAPERPEEVLRAFARGDGEVGTRRVADEERVAGQRDPVVDDERAVLGPVPGRVQHADAGRADLEHVAVGERRERRIRARRASGSRPAARARARSGRAPRRGRRACASRARARSGRRRCSAASR